MFDYSETNWENISGEDDDEYFNLVTSAKDLNHQMAILRMILMLNQQINLLLQKNFYQTVFLDPREMDKTHWRKKIDPSHSEWTYEIENVDVVPQTPINYFIKYFSDNIFLIVSNDSNCYAYMASGKELNNTKKEMKEFFMHRLW